MASTTGGGSTGRRNGEEKFFMTVCDLPREYEWKGLKDLVKKWASHGTWIDVQRVQDGTMLGWVKGIHGLEEARRIFGGLYRELDRSVRIHLHQEGASTKPVLCTCSPDGRTCRLPLARQAADVLRTPPNTSVGIASPARDLQDRTRYPPTPDTSPGSADVDGLVDGLTALQISNLRANIARLCHAALSKDAATATAATQQLKNLSDTSRAVKDLIGVTLRHAKLAAQSLDTVDPSPVYMATPGGTPVNASQGIVKTEARGIFVSDIDYSASAKEVKDFFSRAGTITRCELLKDPKTGRSKGRAVVQFASPTEAVKATNMFNGQPLGTRSMRITVRPDKEAVAVPTAPSLSVPSRPEPSSAASNAARARSNGTSLTRSNSNTGPIIVNGSTVSRV